MKIKSSIIAALGVAAILAAASSARANPTFTRAVFPYSFAQCWSSSTYIFQPAVTSSGGTLSYQWTLDSGSGPVNIPALPRPASLFQHSRLEWWATLTPWR